MKSEIKQNWLQLTSIQIGIFICLPALLKGNILYNQLGLKGAIASLLVGTVISFLLALIQLKLTMTKKQTISEHAQYYFGNFGIFICGLALCISSCGWFSIQLGLMSKTLAQFLCTDKIAIITALLGVLITLVVVFDIKMIEYFSNLTTPIMIGTLCYLLVIPEQSSAQINYGTLSLGGVPLVLSSILTAIVKIPNYFRFSNSYRDGVLSLIIVYLIGAPFVAAVGLMMSIYKPNIDIITLLNGGGSFFWALWITLFLLFAGWTTNNGNLYSAGVAISPFTGHYKKIIFVLGVLSVVVTMLGITENYVYTLNIMSVVIGSMGAVIMTRFLISQSGNENTMMNLFCFSLGIVFGLLNLCNILKITPYVFIDSLLVAASSTLMLGLLRKQIYQSEF